MTYVEFNIIGFVVPLAISMVSFLTLGWLYRSQINVVEVLKNFWPIFILLPTYSLISYYVLPLQKVSAHAVGIDYPMLALVCVYQVYLISKRLHKFAISISYLMGFLVGPLSDIEGLHHLTGTYYFGGAAIHDADFILPLCTVLISTASAGIVIAYDKRKKRKAE